MTFEEYLSQKKIDAELFQKGEIVLFDTWKREFGYMSPESFTAQKKFLLNDTRRKYLAR